jgi:hypothetical protein
VALGVLVRHVRRLAARARFGLLALISVGLPFFPASSAAASSGGWSGSIVVTASFHYDLSNFGGGAHDGYQQWVYFLDGTLDPTYASNPAQTIDSSTWFQPATWNGS